jgi:hypothetical protein
MAALIIGLVINVAAALITELLIAFYKINKKVLAWGGFEPATFSVTDEHAIH